MGESIAAQDHMYCFVSCQSNCGHVASTSLWARYLSFFALICPNYFGSLPPSLTKNLIAFFEMSALLEITNMLCHQGRSWASVITSSPPLLMKKQLQLFLVRFLISCSGLWKGWCPFFFFPCKMIYWRKTGILRSFPTIQCGNDSHYTFCHRVTQRIFYSSFSWSDMQLSSTT